MSNRNRESKSKLLSFILKPYLVFRQVCFCIGFLVIFGFVVFGISIASFVKSLPDLDKKTFEEMKVLAQKRVIAKREDKKKEYRWIDIKNINRNFLYAVVMSEDSGFFEHDGIDIDAILNSVAVNLKHRKYELGASTISQQVVKNLFLGSEKKVFRKIKEILITEKLEKRLSKNEILEIYLNMVEFGPDIFGVNAASQHYFGRPPKDINAPEGAFIALMLPSPRRYHYAIFENRNLSPARRKKIRRILGDMLANDFISSRQYQEYSHYNFMKYLNRSVSDLQQN